MMGNLSLGRDFEAGNYISPAKTEQIWRSPFDSDGANAVKQREALNFNLETSRTIRAPNRCNRRQRQQLFMWFRRVLFRHGGNELSSG